MQRGSEIGVSADPQRCHLFDQGGRALRRLDATVSATGQNHPATAQTA
jgi:multiple sugar transport system ATP-binding protein